MGFSIWELIILLVIFGVPLVAVYRENSEHRINRLPFLLWVVAPYVVGLIGGYLGGTLGSEGFGGFVGLVVALAISYLSYQRYVRRAREAGLGKLIAYLSVIPLVNVLTTLVLIFYPQKIDEQSQAGE
jgi:uncharacterized membrane protein YhaH (DUF805 family)